MHSLRLTGCFGPHRTTVAILPRRKKLGFSMSVMPARVYYDQHQCVLDLQVEIFGD